ncbi:MAG TPA: hypothetical protein VG095_00575, partial [Chthoniobacterales bacterium]|nr:hypothetical protein [Chthoniobacterales bacterium]
MNPLPRSLPLLAAAACCLASSVFAEPIDYSEVSLLVRAREPEASITREVSRRKLVRALTPQQEQALKAQGASDSLLQSLRRSDIILPAAEATAFEARRQQARQGPTAQRAAEAADAGPNVHVFNVAFGQPINLSQWGGLDYEFAFYSYRFAGED